MKIQFNDKYIEKQLLLDTLKKSSIEVVVLLRKQAKLNLRDSKEVVDNLLISPNYYDNIPFISKDFKENDEDSLSVVSDDVLYKENIQGKSFGMNNMQKYVGWGVFCACIVWIIWDFLIK